MGLIEKNAALATNQPKGLNSGVGTLRHKEVAVANWASYQTHFMRLTLLCTFYSCFSLERCFYCEIYIHNMSSLNTGSFHGSGKGSRSSMKPSKSTENIVAFS